MRARHTYAARAETLGEILREHSRETGRRAAVLIGARTWTEALKGRDYFLAEALQRALRDRGIETEIRIRPEWSGLRRTDCVILLRGAEAYTPRKDQVSLMWALPSGQEISAEERASFDAVYVSSGEAGELPEELPEWILRHGFEEAKSRGAQDAPRKKQE